MNRGLTGVSIFRGDDEATQQESFAYFSPNPDCTHPLQGWCVGEIKGGDIDITVNPSMSNKDVANALEELAGIFHEEGK